MGYSWSCLNLKCWLFVRVLVYPHHLNGLVARKKFIKLDAMFLRHNTYLVNKVIKLYLLLSSSLSSSSFNFLIVTFLTQNRTRFSFSTLNITLIKCSRKLSVALDLSESTLSLKNQFTYQVLIQR